MSHPPVAPLTNDPYLEPFLPALQARAEQTAQAEQRLAPAGTALEDFAAAHTWYGLHRTDTGWVFREWAPHATAIHLRGTVTDWSCQDAYRLTRRDGSDDWELHLPADALQHGDLYNLHMEWSGGSGSRIPAYARRVVQDPHTHIFNAQVWAPAEPYQWQHERPPRPDPLLIYEAHVGMANEDGRVGTYCEFRDQMLPRIAGAGYNAIELMAIMEHPYYGSFGYHISSFFAASSRFGTPEELKSLIDRAHELGLHVIMDIVHSHAVKNQTEGISCFDGTVHQYFHDGERGDHVAWDSRCFDYGKPQVQHFLLSNCRYWLDEYRFDGYRFDGVTSMLYFDHGLGAAFGGYDCYFDETRVDSQAITYLALANKVIHAVLPDAITIAEDVSGMPGLGAPPTEGGCGFDYRMAMGVPDCWFKLANDIPDEAWDMHWLWHELTNRRQDERTISYVECHDQAMVGGKTMIFELLDAAMYHGMHNDHRDINVDRGLSLHKMMRLATLFTAGHGYLNFMGNEFGHPEWIDFPREGNDWSYHYARRQWHLRDDPSLRYKALGDFDAELMQLAQRSGGRMDPRSLQIDNERKLILFERNGLFVFLNFHPHAPIVDHPINVMPGSYELVLDTDRGMFGGFDRIACDQHYVTQTMVEQNELHHQLKIYLPPRTAIVLRKVPANPS